LIVLLICTLVIVNSLLAESPRNGGQGRAESMHADARG
jgi:hypothetical protein